MLELLIYSWRFLSGHFMDGEQHGNSSWFKRGTFPSHHLTWWSRKARIERAYHRWLMIVIPAGWLIAYHYAPVIRMNAALLYTGMLLPFGFLIVVKAMLTRLTRVRVVHVFEDSEPASQDIVDHYTDTGQKMAGDISSLTEAPFPAEMTQPRRNRRVTE